MPELPEVERAVRFLNEWGAGKMITKVETAEDTIVYSGVTHTDFAKTLTGRRMIQACRYGKLFYMELDGEGKHPVMHFGMTGLLHAKGQLPIRYKGSSGAADPGWPPRWMKFILHFMDPEGGQATEIAFRDARRLGRIRLCASPPFEPPISELGFDPIHTMPPLTLFSNLVRNRKRMAIKALLLDQSFSAGIGNWVADEVLYHSWVHPQQRCNTLTENQIQALHENIVYVCETATSVNADDKKFPENWLFMYRWGKDRGKENQKGPPLPSGETATIKWVTVAGRTSAFVVELQKISASSPTDNRIKLENTTFQPTGDINTRSELAGEIESTRQGSIGPERRHTIRSSAVVRRAARHAGADVRL